MLPDDLGKVKKTRDLRCSGDTAVLRFTAIFRKTECMVGDMPRGRSGVRRSIASARVALAQVNPALGDLAANISMHLQSAREAIRRGARLIVFPELSLTGYRLQDLVSEVSINLNTPTAIQPLLEMSRRIPMVVGLVEESEGHRYYNSVVYLENGRIRHAHRKIYLPTYGMFEEGRYFSAGDGLRSFRTRLGRVGMLVCEDLWHQSTPLLLSQDGADYIIVSSSSPSHGILLTDRLGSQQTWRDLLKVTAQMQTVFMVWVNRVGFEDGINFGGGSCVFDPFGTRLVEAGHLDREILVCELDRAALRRARTARPLLRDERLTLLWREVQRLISVPTESRGPGGS